MALNLQHQTAAEFAYRFWERLDAAFRSGDKFQYHLLIWWVWDRIQSGDLTNVQVRDSFNAWRADNGKAQLNPAQWNTLVQNRFIPIKDRYLALIAEGEL